MIDACVRGHARGELASKPLRLKARDPLVGVWNGCIYRSIPGVSLALDPPSVPPRHAPP